MKYGTTVPAAPHLSWVEHGKSSVFLVGTDFSALESSCPECVPWMDVNTGQPRRHVPLLTVQGSEVALFDCQDQQTLEDWPRALTDIFAASTAK